MITRSPHAHTKISVTTNRGTSGRRHWSYLRFRPRDYLITFAYSWPQNLALKTPYTLIYSIVWCWYTDRRLFRFVSIHAFDRQTDRQRDRQKSDSNSARHSLMSSLINLNTPLSLLCVPFTTTAIGRKAFRFAAPTIWNSIPLSIRSLPSLNSFKRSLKIHLFSLDSLWSRPRYTSASDSSFAWICALYKFCIIIIIIIIIILENLGALSRSTLEFLGDLGRKLSSFSGEERATSFLFQRLSVSLQRFHSVLLHDTFMIDDVPDQ